MHQTPFLRTSTGVFHFKIMRYICYALHLVRESVFAVLHLFFLMTVSKPDTFFLSIPQLQRRSLQKIL